MANRGDTEFLEVIAGQRGQNLGIDVILTECRLVLPEAQTPQPDQNVHDGAHSELPRIMVLARGGV